MKKEKPIPEIVKAVMENATDERRNSNGNQDLISYSQRIARTLTGLLQVVK